VRYQVKPKAPPPPTAVPSINAYPEVKSDEQVEDFMRDVLGSMSSAPPADIPASPKHKTRSEYVHDGSSSPITSASSVHWDASSDGPLDDGHVATWSDDFTNPKKRHKIDIIAPATRGMERLEVKGPDEYDDPFDDVDTAAFVAFVDMAAFVDAADGDVDSKVRGLHEFKMEVDEGKPVDDIPPKKMELDTQSWLSVYDSLKVTTEESFGPLTSSSRSDTASRFFVSLGHHLSLLRLARTPPLEYLPSSQLVPSDFIGLITLNTKVKFTS
jgi:DNA polymerase alpha subunit A